MNAKHCFFLFLVGFFCTQACECGKGKDIPDVSQVSAPVELRRFEQALFSLDTNDMAQGLPTLETDFGEFSEIFFGQVLGSKDPKIAPQGHADYVRGFIAHPGVRKLYDTTQVVFPDTKQLEKEFGQAFRFFKYYFPEQPLSGEVVTFLSEYTIGGFLYGENSVAVGLDLYLGEAYPYAAQDPSNPNFSKYLTRTFNQAHIVSKSMKLLVQDLLRAPKGNRLIDHIVHNGKGLYVLDQILPTHPDSVRLEFSQKQVEWCNENEANIWAYFLSESLLYDTDFNKYRKFIEHSPNSPGMPEEAPSRTGDWLGWQIVKAYMKKHPETSLSDLIALEDAQAILDASKYKPRK